MTRIRDITINRVIDIPTLTARAAARWGERTAITFDETDERLSFLAVETQSNRIANALIAHGVRPTDRVALMLRNRPEFPLSWIGIVKAGAVTVPLNVFYKTTDAGYLLNHAGVTRIICEDDLMHVVAKAVPSLVKNDAIITVGSKGSFNALLSDSPIDSPPITITPESLANLQYTSGTTGQPKGCMLSNSYFMNFGWRVAIAHEGLNENDVMLTAQPFYYVDPQWNCITSLLVGAELVVLDRFHPSTFWNRIREHNVTWFYCLGVMPKLLLKTPRQATDRAHRLCRVMCFWYPKAGSSRNRRTLGCPLVRNFRNDRDRTRYIRSSCGTRWASWNRLYRTPIPYPRSSCC